MELWFTLLGDMLLADGYSSKADLLAAFPFLHMTQMDEKYINLFGSDEVWEQKEIAKFNIVLR